MPAERPAFSPPMASGQALHATVKYNPHLWGPDELRAIFVVRTRELDDLLARLRASADGRVPQHLLITGARGMGKTTLLRRLALAVSDDPALSARWVPVTFPEEQYTVSTLAELWRNVLDALADTREREGAAPDELECLDLAIREIGELPVAGREDAALTALHDWVATHGRRLLLLIDSTDLLLANLAGGAAPAEPGGGRTRGGARIDGGATALWRLRNTLSNDTGLFWLGASYQALETDHAYQDAFWDFFERVELRALTVAEMRAAMLALARAFGAGRGLTGAAAVAEMARTLDTRPERLKALRAITGGNPRTTVMLYELFAAGGADDVHGDLRRLLDTMTPLYKARLESLSDQARKLLAHLLEHWAPIGARDLGSLAGIATNTVSGQLVRLEAEGLVEKAPLRGRRRAGYQAAERLFNVWYLMRYASRRDRQRLSWLVEFMRLWYSADEMTSLARQRAGQHAGGRLCRGEHLEFSRALSLALPDGAAERYRLEWAVFGTARRGLRQSRAALGEYFALDGEDQEYSTAEDYLSRFEALDAGLARCPHLTDATRGAWIEAVKGSLGLTLAEKEAVAAAATGISEAEYQKRLQALAGEQGRWESWYGETAIQTVRNAVLAGGFFPDCPDSKLAHHQVLACFTDEPETLEPALDLFARHHRDQWLETTVRDALKIFPQVGWLWGRLGDRLRWQEGRSDEAEAAYRRAIELDPGDPLVWESLGDLLTERTERTDEAEFAYRRSIELDPDGLFAWWSLGDLLAARSDRTDEAEAAYRRVIDLDPGQPLIWRRLGDLLAEQSDRTDEAEAAYRRAIELDPGEPLVWTHLGDLLTEQSDRIDEAEAAFRRAIELDPGEPFVWGSLGDLLAGQRDRTDDAVAAYRHAVERDPRDAISWRGLGDLLAGRVGHGDEAEAAFRRAIDLEPTDGGYWHSLGELLADQLERPREAESAYREALRLAPEDPFTTLNLARLLAFVGHRPEADALYRQAITLAEPRDAKCAKAGLTEFTNLLLQAHLWLGQRDQALEALDRLAGAAAAGDAEAFRRIKEQARECHRLGLGPRLRDLMIASPWAGFLAPFALALDAANAADPAEALAGAPQEVRTLAAEVLAGLGRRATSGGDGASAGDPVSPPAG